jgi:hypothetical protein
MNGFGNEEAAYLGDALKENDTLTTLDISYNRIHVDGCQYIAKGLAQNKSLKTLHVFIPVSAEYNYFDPFTFCRCG